MVQFFGGIRRIFSVLLVVLLGSIMFPPATWGQPTVEELEKRLKQDASAKLKQADRFPKARRGDDREEQEPGGRPIGNQPGYLGIIGDDRNEGGQGLRIMKIIPESPAETAGLVVGDLITAIDGRAISSVEAFVDQMTEQQAGDTLEFTLRRGLKQLKVAVTLSTRPDDEGIVEPAIPAPADFMPMMPEALLQVGVVGIPVDDVLQGELNLPSDHGILAIMIVPRSPVAAAKLLPGTIIVAANGVRIDTIEELEDAIGAAKENKEIKLAFYSKGQLREKRIPLANLPAISTDGDRGMAARPLGKPGDDGVSVEAKVLELQARIDQLEETIRDSNQRAARIEQMLKKLVPPTGN